MTTTHEILWYGRGGQGAFSASKLLGASFALSSSDYFALAFPSFGPERRGAPVRAYTKLSDAPINNRSAVEHPDYVVCLDETLVKDLGSLAIREGGAFICVNDDVTAFSTERLGRPIVNTTLLALLALQLDDVSADDIERGIHETTPERIQDKNIALVRAVFDNPESLASAVHPVEQLTPAEPLPHERNQVIGGAEYMDLRTAEGIGKPQQPYTPGGEA